MDEIKVGDPVIISLIGSPSDGLEGKVVKIFDTCPTYYKVEFFDEHPTGATYGIYSEDVLI